MNYGYKKWPGDIPTTINLDVAPMPLLISSIHSDLISTLLTNILKAKAQFVKADVSADCIRWVIRDIDASFYD